MTISSVNSTSAAFEYLKLYGDMVNQQEQELESSITYLRPLFKRLQHLAKSNQKLPPLQSSEHKSLKRIMNDENELSNSISLIDLQLAHSRLSPSDDDKKSGSYYDEVISSDKQFIMTIDQLTKTEEECVTFLDFVHCYRTIVNGMMLMELIMKKDMRQQYEGEQSIEEEKVSRSRTRQRTMEMLMVFQNRSMRNLNDNQKEPEQKEEIKKIDVETQTEENGTEINEAKAETEVKATNDTQIENIDQVQEKKEESAEEKKVSTDNKEEEEEKLSDEKKESVEGMKKNALTIRSQISIQNIILFSLVIIVIPLLVAVNFKLLQDQQKILISTLTESAKSTINEHKNVQATTSVLINKNSRKTLASIESALNQNNQHQVNSLQSLLNEITKEIVSRMQKELTSTTSLIVRNQQNEHLKCVRQFERQKIMSMLLYILFQQRVQLLQTEKQKKQEMLLQQQDMILEQQLTILKQQKEQQESNLMIQQQQQQLQKEQQLRKAYNYNEVVVYSKDYEKEESINTQKKKKRFWNNVNQFFHFGKKINESDLNEL